MNTHEIDERSGVAVDPRTAGGQRGSCYLPTGPTLGSKPCMAGSETMFGTEQGPRHAVSPAQLPDYLERALWDASRDASARSRPARVYARFAQWWDATMIDEIAQTRLGEVTRSPEWWADKFQELSALADRETPMEGFEL
jgi:hypothetical protein